MSPQAIDLPRTDRVRRPPRYLLHPLRPPARALLRGRYDVRVHGADHVPSSGAVILAANHIGVIDGPLLAIFAPRPVHALTKVEMFSGALGRFLHGAGQIPLDRFHADVRAVRTGIRTLRAGAALGIFPEGARGAGDLERFHRGAAYFALVTGAPIVPVVLLGTRDPGGHTGSLPSKGARLDLVFGAPFEVECVPWPRTRERVATVSLELRGRMLADLRAAVELTGRSLPGPLPAGEKEPDPGGGVTRRSA